MFGEAVYPAGGLPCYLSTNVRIVSSDGPAAIGAVQGAGGE